MAAAAGISAEKRLSADRIARLEALGFVWSPRKSRAQEERIIERQRLYEENWEDYYQRLAHFKMTHGVSYYRRDQCLLSKGQKPYRAYDPRSSSKPVRVLFCDTHFGGN